MRVNLTFLLKPLPSAWIGFNCNITYDMDFRFVPSDPVCFDKLSYCDKSIGQRVRAVGLNRCVTGRRARDKNHAGRFRESRESSEGHAAEQRRL